MDFISDRVNSFAGNALSDIRNRWIQQPAGEAAPNSSAIEIPSGQTRASNREDLSPYYSAPLAGGLAFGGDSHTRLGGASPLEPPPIGFRTDLLVGADQQHPPSQPGVLTQAGPAPHIQPQSGAARQPPDGSLAASSESLYEGDAWSRLWFQRVMILALLRLLLFVRKVYEDFHATKVYKLTGEYEHFLIAATTLLLPTAVFTLYRVSRYLQLALPSLRASKQQQASAARRHQTASDPLSAAKRPGPTGQSDEDKQLTRALMSSPDQSGGMATPVGGSAGDDEGLVTARQTPNLEEFHDSKSQQDAPVEAAVVEIAAAKPPASPQEPNGETVARPPEKLESVNVDKLGNLPDRETVRVLIGASEQLLHGVLFIFWQLKRQVDVLGYLVERACLWRKPAEREKDQLNRMNCHRDGLEWFQDFYAAFLAIMAQVYALGMQWTEFRVPGHQGQPVEVPASRVMDALDGAPDEANSLRRTIGIALGQNQTYLWGEDVLLVSELVVSAGVVVSLLICVRRRDDGPLTLGLSMLGWGSLFAARIILIALAFVQIKWPLVLLCLGLHVLGITRWIYSIALDSHNGLASELDDEAVWDEEAALEQGRQQEAATELAVASSSQAEDAEQPPPLAPKSASAHQEAAVVVARVTDTWSRLEHAILVSQILTLFALPSLFYWPIMFNLKLHQRPFKYLVLILTQNFLLIATIWWACTRTLFVKSDGQLYLAGLAGALSVLGFIFVSLYVACKPQLTEYFARADELFHEADKSGIYYEFCSRVFRMPDLGKRSFKRLMDQTQEEVEEELGSTR